MTLVHAELPPALAGVRLDQARLIAVMVHGRGQSPAYMISAAAERLRLPDVAYVLPQAHQGSWYPGRFSAPVQSNQPWLDQGLEALEAAIGLASSATPLERIVLVGFSQGACLTAELLARRPRPLRAAAILTGALIGTAGELVRPEPLDGLPMYISSSRFDEWVPPDAVQDTARRFEEAGAQVTLEISDEREHRISDREIEAIRGLLTDAHR